ncbi:iron complex outermembrane receptor protein [Sphingomonas vulcanisoli]|uniref:Iron complex outermembrane receptor protein n=1 Tax=Sphingomonas vulcanisoli TaxID=1658060 RepID=A0ABX0TPI2_9SPHN|nr:TonB-dependent receptor [Sphingomonas vulcanisoli]NIJ06530.1 iron complex outermembrane receptor protein [Sphingomonas vulcanisoli]
MHVSKLSALLLAGISTIVVAPMAAQAQSTTTVAPADAGADKAIVVTAQRRTENAITVPIAVSVLRTEQLHDYQAAGSDTLLSLSGKVPSLYVETSTGRIFPRFYIRGLGNIDFYLGASQPVEIVMDDVVEEHVVLKSNPAFDIAQVEVLKGPQGSLFGRNTTAGIVKFDTIQPSATWQGQASASYGTKNSVDVDAGVGGPLTKDGSISFRLSGLYQHRDNWIRNTYTGPSDDGTTAGKLNGFNERDVRLQVLAKPSDAFSIRVSGHYRDYDGFASIFYRGSIIQGTSQVPNGFNRGVVQYDEAQNNPQAYKTHGASVKAAYDLGDATITSITAWEHLSGYSRGDTDGGAAINFPLGGVPFGYGESQGRVRGLDQWTQELRVSSPDTGPFKWQFGGMYFSQRDRTEFDQRSYFLTSNIFGTAPNPNNFVLLHNVNTSWAGFGQASYQLTDKLTLTGGVRVTKDTKSTDLLLHPNVAALAVPATAPNSSYSCGTAFYCRLSSTKPSFDASLLYRVDPNVSLYARVARGFRGPTVQGRSAVFGSAYTTATSETNTSWEAGVKTAALNNAVHFNVAGFYYTVKNIQLNGNDSNGNGVLFNGNKGVGYGAEAELQARPTSRLSFTAGFSWLHTEIKDRNVFVQAGAAGGVLAETVLNPTVRLGNNYYAQINGNPFPNAPQYNVNLSGRYDLPLDDRSKLFIAGDFNMQGKTYYTLYKTIEYRSNGNYELGGKIGYAFSKYEVAAFVRNLTNEKNLIDVIDTNNYRAGIYNDPRIFGVMVSGSFR